MEDRSRQSPAATVSIAAVARMFEVTLESQALTIQQYRVLAYINQAPGTPSDLAYRLSVQAPTVTRLVAALSERGFIARRVDKSDRRRNVLTLTRAGRRAIERAGAATQEAIDRILLPIPAKDRATIDQGLKLLGGAMLGHWRMTHPDANGNGTR